MTARPRPVRAVPDPKPPRSQRDPASRVEPFYPMQMRVVLGGEPMTRYTALHSELEAWDVATQGQRDRHGLLTEVTRLARELTR